MPVGATTPIQISGGWWATAAMRLSRSGCPCGNAPSLIGDLNRTAVAAYATGG